jgi:hypothetical protein
MPPRPDSLAERQRQRIAGSVIPVSSDPLSPSSEEEVEAFYERRAACSLIVRNYLQRAVAYSASDTLKHDLTWTRFGLPIGTDVTIPPAEWSAATPDQRILAQQCRTELLDFALLDMARRSRAYRTYVIMFDVEYKTSSSDMSNSYCVAKLFTEPPGYTPFIGARDNYIVELRLDPVEVESILAYVVKMGRLSVMRSRRDSESIRDSIDEHLSSMSDGLVGNAIHVIRTLGGRRNRHKLIELGSNLVMNARHIASFLLKGKRSDVHDLYIRFHSAYPHPPFALASQVGYKYSYSDHPGSPAVEVASPVLVRKRRRTATRTSGNTAADDVLPELTEDEEEVGPSRDGMPNVTSEPIKYKRPRVPRRTKYERPPPLTRRRNTSARRSRYSKPSSSFADKFRDTSIGPGDEAYDLLMDVSAEPIDVAPDNGGVTDEQLYAAAEAAEAAEAAQGLANLQDAALVQSGEAVPAVTNDMDAAAAALTSIFSG